MVEVLTMLLHSVPAVLVFTALAEIPDACKVELLFIASAIAFASTAPLFALERAPSKSTPATVIVSVAAVYCQFPVIKALYAVVALDLTRLAPCTTYAPIFDAFTLLILVVIVWSALGP